MRKALSILLAMGMTLGMSTAAFAGSESAVSAVEAVAGDEAAEAAEFLESIKGTYEALFPVILDSQYDQVWLDPCIEAVGEDMAADVAGMLKQACNGTIYGQEAIDAFGDGSEGAQFDCLFINGVSQITFDGNTISGVDENGEQVFSHEYEYVSMLSLAGLMEGRLYETSDEDAGEFRYFYMMPDTPDTTYHLEFRYGSDTEALSQYNEGPYAYWLAAGFPVDADEQLTEDVITLFCEENLAELDEEEGESQEAVSDADSAAEDLTGAEESLSAAEAAEEVIEISTAEELAAVNDNLSGNYILTADIDLEGAEWTPIGSFVFEGETEEEQVVPNGEYAFTGTFDGNGHTISNLVINQPEGMAIGLFGCISETEIGGFTLENAEVTGTLMAAGVVGYSYCSTVSDITAKDVSVNVNYTDISGEGMFGGIVGAGMASLITGCEADAVITIPDNVGNAGIVGGGLELTSLVDCTASGSVTAGANCYGLGGISGCGFGAEEFTGCYAHDVIITAGSGSRWIGGITGYAGGFEDESLGVPVTVFSGCEAEQVEFNVPEDAEGVGEIVGAGFFSEEAAEAMGEPYDQPTVFVIEDAA